MKVTGDPFIHPCMLAVWNDVEFLSLLFTFI